ncbi:hypothetical protein GMRT_14261 [Giardia muris]|uniref:Uncharacterized protein n=1 Tax=Giardia muris TaxID=5742 RepID=A0A4Z1T3H8_GIAMU|nr:hypothetical protein GMRT_14261 [Giardia muris]|eukprot:TNJ30198.1 hypothetical protein GMRT_14261 [Giardia muris]
MDTALLERLRQTGAQQRASLHIGGVGFLVFYVLFVIQMAGTYDSIFFAKSPLVCVLSLDMSNLQSPLFIPYTKGYLGVFVLTLLFSLILSVTYILIITVPQCVSIASTPLNYIISLLSATTFRPMLLNLWPVLRMGTRYDLLGSSAAAISPEAFGCSSNDERSCLTLTILQLLIMVVSLVHIIVGCLAIRNIAWVDFGTRMTTAVISGRLLLPYYLFLVVNTILSLIRWPVLFFYRDSYIAGLQLVLSLFLLTYSLHIHAFITLLPNVAFTYFAAYCTFNASINLLISNGSNVSISMSKSISVWVFIIGYILLLLASYFIAGLRQRHLIGRTIRFLLQTRRKGMVTGEPFGLEEVFLPPPPLLRILLIPVIVFYSICLFIMYPFMILTKGWAASLSQRFMFYLSRRSYYSSTSDNKPYLDKFLTLKATRSTPILSYLAQLIQYRQLTFIEMLIIRQYVKDSTEWLLDDARDDRDDLYFCTSDDTIQISTYLARSFKQTLLHSTFQGEWVPNQACSYNYYFLSQIYLILASQRPNTCVAPLIYFSLLGNLLHQHEKVAQGVTALILHGVSPTVNVDATNAEVDTSYRRSAEQRAFLHFLLKNRAELIRHLNENIDLYVDDLIALYQSLDSTLPLSPEVSAMIDTLHVRILSGYLAAQSYSFNDRSIRSIWRSRLGIITTRLSCLVSERKKNQLPWTSTSIIQSVENTGFRITSWDSSTMSALLKIYARNSNGNTNDSTMDIKKQELEYTQALVQTFVEFMQKRYTDVNVAFQNFYIFRTLFGEIQSAFYTIQRRYKSDPIHYILHLMLYLFLPLIPTTSYRYRALLKLYKNTNLVVMDDGNPFYLRHHINVVLTSKRYDSPNILSRQKRYSRSVCPHGLQGDNIVGNRYLIESSLRLGKAESRIPLEASEYEVNVSGDIYHRLLREFQHLMEQLRLANGDKKFPLKRRGVVSQTSRLIKRIPTTNDIYLGVMRKDYLRAVILMKDYQEYKALTLHTQRRCYVAGRILLSLVFFSLIVTIIIICRRYMQLQIIGFQETELKVSNHIRRFDEIYRLSQTLVSLPSSFSNIMHPMFQRIKSVLYLPELQYTVLSPALPIHLNYSAGMRPGISQAWSLTRLLAEIISTLEYVTGNGLRLIEDLTAVEYTKDSWLTPLQGKLTYALVCTRQYLNHMANYGMGLSTAGFGSVKYNPWIFTCAVFLLFSVCGLVFIPLSSFDHFQRDFSILLNLLISLPQRVSCSVVNYWSRRNLSRLRLVDIFHDNLPAYCECLMRDIRTYAGSDGKHPPTENQLLTRKRYDKQFRALLSKFIVQHSESQSLGRNKTRMIERYFRFQKRYAQVIDLADAQMHEKDDLGELHETDDTRTDTDSIAEQGGKHIRSNDLRLGAAEYRKLIRSVRTQSIQLIDNDRILTRSMRLAASRARKTRRGCPNTCRFKGRTITPLLKDSGDSWIFNPPQNPEGEEDRMKSSTHSTHSPRKKTRRDLHIKPLNKKVYLSLICMIHLLLLFALLITLAFIQLLSNILENMHNKDFKCLLFSEGLYDLSQELAYGQLVRGFITTGDDKFRTEYYKVTAQHNITRIVEDVLADTYAMSGRSWFFMNILQHYYAIILEIRRLHDIGLFLAITANYKTEELLLHDAGTNDDIFLPKDFFMDMIRTSLAYNFTNESLDSESMRNYASFFPADDTLGAIVDALDLSEYTTIIEDVRQSPDERRRRAFGTINSRYYFALVGMHHTVATSLLQELSRLRTLSFIDELIDDNPGYIPFFQRYFVSFVRASLGERFSALNAFYSGDFVTGALPFGSYYRAHVPDTSDIRIVLSTLPKLDKTEENQEAVQKVLERRLDTDFDSELMLERYAFQYIRNVCIGGLVLSFTLYLTLILVTQKAVQMRLRIIKIVSLTLIGLVYTMILILFLHINVKMSQAKNPGYVNALMDVWAEYHSLFDWLDQLSFKTTLLALAMKKPGISSTMSDSLLLDLMTELQTGMGLTVGSYDPVHPDMYVIGLSYFRDTHPEFETDSELIDAFLVNNTIYVDNDPSKGFMPDSLTSLFEKKSSLPIFFLSDSHFQQTTRLVYLIPEEATDEYFNSLKIIQHETLNDLLTWVRSNSNGTSLVADNSFLYSYIPPRRTTFLQTSTLTALNTLPQVAMEYIATIRRILGYYVIWRDSTDMKDILNAHTVYHTLGLKYILDAPPGYAESLLLSIPENGNQYVSNVSLGSYGVTRLTSYVPYANSTNAASLATLHVESQTFVRLQLRMHELFSSVHLSAVQTIGDLFMQWSLQSRFFSSVFIVVPYVICLTILFMAFLILHVLSHQNLRMPPSFLKNQELSLVSRHALFRQNRRYAISHFIICVLIVALAISSTCFIFLVQYLEAAVIYSTSVIKNLVGVLHSIRMIQSQYIELLTCLITPASTCGLFQLGLLFKELDKSMERLHDVLGPFQIIANVDTPHPQTTRVKDNLLQQTIYRQNTPLKIFRSTEFSLDNALLLDPKLAGVFYSGLNGTDANNVSTAISFIQLVASYIQDGNIFRALSLIALDKADVMNLVEPFSYMQDLVRTNISNPVYELVRDLMEDRSVVNYNYFDVDTLKDSLFSRSLLQVVSTLRQNTETLANLMLDTDHIEYKSDLLNSLAMGLDTSVVKNYLYGKDRIQTTVQALTFDLAYLNVFMGKAEETLVAKQVDTLVVRHKWVHNMLWIILILTLAIVIVFLPMLRMISDIALLRRVLQLIPREKYRDLPPQYRILLYDSRRKGFGLNS